MRELEKFPQPPRLSDQEIWYYQCYEELAFDRYPTMSGAQVPIPMFNLISYANHLGLSDFERDLLIRVVRRIDFIECESVNKRLRNK